MVETIKQCERAPSVQKQEARARQADDPPTLCANYIRANMEEQQHPMWNGSEKHVSYFTLPSHTMVFQPS